MLSLVRTLIRKAANGHWHLDGNNETRGGLRDIYMVIRHETLWDCGSGGDGSKKKKKRHQGRGFLSVFLPACLPASTEGLNWLVEGEKEEKSSGGSGGG